MVSHPDMAKGQPCRQSTLAGFSQVLKGLGRVVEYGRNIGCPQLYAPRKRGGVRNIPWPSV
jgi:hypothetical protein